MQFTTIFFDLDDTLYPSSCGLWSALKARMNSYMHERMGLPEEEIPQLREKYFMNYGTTLRGLRANHPLDEEDFLAYVHDLPLKDYLTPDPALRSLIASLPARKLIFTNADSNHAKRVLAALELEGCFESIVDLHHVEPYCKPMPEAFKVAMTIARETDPARCVMIDDLPRNTGGARQAGMFSILYGQDSPNANADACITDWNMLSEILSDLQFEK